MLCAEEDLPLCERLPWVRGFTDATEVHYAVYAVRVRVKTVSPPQHRPSPLDPLRTSPGPHNTQFGYLETPLWASEEKAP